MIKYFVKLKWFSLTVRSLKSLPTSGVIIPGEDEDEKHVGNGS